MSATASWSTSVIPARPRSEEHTSELQSPCNFVCRLLLEKKKPPGVAELGDVKEYARDLKESDPDRGVSSPSLDFLFGPVECDRDDRVLSFFFFNDTATTEIYTLSLHDALPI